MEHAEGRGPRDLVIAFIDLSFYARDASQRDDEVVAQLADVYYERVGDGAARAGGVVVKVLGDGALLAFPVDRADDALGELFALKAEIDAWLAADAWASRVTVKLHRGVVVAGDFGRRGAKRFDVLGKVVNVTARLPGPFHVTRELFDSLSPAARARLKEDPASATYVPADDGSA